MINNLNVGIFLIVLTFGFWPWAAGAALLGIGTTPRCWQPLAMWPIRGGAPRWWESTSSGAMVADALGLYWAIGAVGGLTL